MRTSVSAPRVISTGRPVCCLATVGGARALGVAAQGGTIEVGKRADLILIHLDAIHNQPVNDLFSQLVHCAKASDVQTVLVNGRVLMRDRQLQIAEERKILEEARKANLDLMTRLNTLSF